MRYLLVAALAFLISFTPSVADGEWVSFGNHLFWQGATIDKNKTLTHQHEKTVWIGAEHFGLGGSTDPTLEMKNGKLTYAFADATADDTAYVSFGIPSDLDDGFDVDVRVSYLCDQATPTEGEWNLSYMAVGDSVADAALTTGLTVLDTGDAQNDWNLTGAMTIPASAIDATDYVIWMELHHDVDDPLCGGENVNVDGLQLTYTADINE